MIPRLTAPIILLCSERSGSNLVTKMFDAHPDVVAPGTSHLFRVFGQIGWTYTGAPEELHDDMLGLFRAKVGSWAIDDRSDADLRTLLAGCRGPAQAVVSLFEAERAAAHKQRVLVREDHIYELVPFIESVCTEPHYLHVVRDPRDMAASWKKAAVIRGGVVRAARRWCRDQANMVRTLDWLATSRPTASLTYEALISEPEATLTRACTQLGLAFAPGMLAFSSQSRSAQADAGRAAAWRNLDKPLMSDNAHKFRAELSDDEIAYVEALCAPLMERLGYVRARHGLPPYGSHRTFAELEAALVAVEPHDKPQYADLPAAERAMFERWSARHAQLLQRSGVALLDVD